MRNMEEINSLLHDFTPQQTQKVESIPQAPVIITDIGGEGFTPAFIDDVEFEEDFEESIEIDPDLDEARRLNAGRT